MKLDQSVFTYSLKEATILANMWSKYGNGQYYTAKFDPRVANNVN